MDVEALVEAPFVKQQQNGPENGHGPHPGSPPRERLASLTRSSGGRRSPSPSSEYSRHSSSRQPHKPHRDDRDYYRRDHSRSDSRDYDDRHRSDSHRRPRDDRPYNDDRSRRSEDRYRDRDERYHQDRNDRRRSRNDEHEEERHSKRRREYDDRGPVDAREKPREPEVYTRYGHRGDCDAENREKSPELTEEERDQRTVFVQQLAARLRTKEIIKFFEQAGPVREAQIVKDRISGRSKGVGYVEFRNPGSVAEAISMTGQRLLGLPIIVSITEAEKNRQARLDQIAAGSGPSKEVPIHRLYIGNIHFSLTEDDIKEVFSPFGDIDRLQLQKEHDTGRSRGYGFVQYRDPLDAVSALEKLNGLDIGGRAIRVGLGNDKFTNESTQAILDRYNRFRDMAADTVPRDDDTERLDRGHGPPSAGGRGRGAGPQPNLDDSDVLGISMSSSSRDALMRKLAREEPKEEAAPYDLCVGRGAESRPPKPETVVAAPDVSRCVLLKNCFDSAEETGDSWARELEDDVKHECESKYGKVNHIHVEPESQGEIYIKFDSVSGGEKAIQGLNGRWFGGRSLVAAAIPDAVYTSKFPRARAL